MMTTNPPSQPEKPGALSAFDRSPGRPDSVFSTHLEPGFRVLELSGAPLVAFTTRLGGVSAGPFRSLNLGFSSGDRPEAVEENRRRLREALGPDEVASLSQVHGNDCLPAAAGGLAGSGDALFTTRQDLALAIGTADCLGIVLWDGDRRALAAAHAGWRGIVAGVIESAARRITEAFPDGVLHAAIGPGIRACCFEVGPEVAERFPADCVLEGRPIRVDLARAARQRLLAIGVAPDRLLDLGECTSCEEATYFSHRRDRGTTGRHWTVARLAPWKRTLTGAS
jgi:YfiH family protein